MVVPAATPAPPMVWPVRSRIRRNFLRLMQQVLRRLLLPHRPHLRAQEGGGHVAQGQQSMRWQQSGSSYRWLDALGRVVRQGPMAGGPQQRLEREGLASGSYLLELRNTEGRLRTARVVWE